MYTEEIIIFLLHVKNIVRWGVGAE